jgi:hypothetical protein
MGLLWSAVKGRLCVSGVNSVGLFRVSVVCLRRASMHSPSRFPVETRATAEVMQATASGILIPERTLGRDPKREDATAEVEPAWFKVTKTSLGHSQRFGMVLRDSHTKTQSSHDAPDFLKIPEVRRIGPERGVESNGRSLVAFPCRCNHRLGLPRWSMTLQLHDPPRKTPWKL